LELIRFVQAMALMFIAVSTMGIAFYCRLTMEERKRHNQVMERLVADSFERIVAELRDRRP
jgi:hypothetical protein